jgi:dTDP-4-amino-4,6-dideoxygalactose transaminase
MSKRLEGINDLALFNGKQTLFPDNAVKAVGAPRCTIDVDEFLTHAREILLSGQWTNNGPNVKRLEEEIAQYINVKHVILINNATVGLQVALKACDVNEGEVIVPSFTFIATAHAAAWLGLRVVFCDVDAHSLMLDVDCLARLITPNTRAVIPVHVYGRTAEVEVIQSVIGDRQIKVVTDAAHAFACQYADGSFVGAKGDCEVFSFHATKAFSTMEGGAIATNDDAIAQRARSIINFGFTGYDRVEAIGTNGKMCELIAAYGSCQLRKLPLVLALNRRNFCLYQSLFYEQSVKDKHWQRCIKFFDAPVAACNCHYVVVRWEENGTSVNRDFVVTALNSENCHLRRYFYPGVHALGPYKDCQPMDELHLPVTVEVAKKVICLPTGPQMETDDICKLFSTLVFIWNQRDAIHAHLMSPSAGSHRSVSDQ